MTSPDRAVTLCGQRLSGRQHVCAFVDSTDEQYRILNPFFREEIDAGEEVVTIVESEFHGEHLRRMRAGGVGVDAAVAAGQLKLLASEVTYLNDGVFVIVFLPAPDPVPPPPFHLPPGRLPRMRSLPARRPRFPSPPPPAGAALARSRLYCGHG